MDDVLKNWFLQKKTRESNSLYSGLVININGMSLSDSMTLFTSLTLGPTIENLGPSYESLQFSRIFIFN